MDVAEVPGRVPDTPGLTVSTDRRSVLYSQFSITDKDLTR